MINDSQESDLNSKTNIHIGKKKKKGVIAYLKKEMSNFKKEILN